MKKEFTDSTLKLRDGVGRIEAHSRSLRKELGLLNVSLMQILILLQITWIGAAAKSGTSHILFWLLAIILFFIPSAVVVVYLSRLMPLEGGLYQWAKLGFNDFVGFMVGWNYYISGIVFIATIGIDVAVCLSYIAAPGTLWMAANKWVITATNCTVIGALVIASLLGLSVSRRFYNAGGVIRVLLLVVLAGLPFFNSMAGTLPDYRPLRVTAPNVTTSALLLLNLNILGKMAFGAFSGFEEVSVLAGECRNPVRTISRSVLIAAPVVAVLYVLATDSVVALLPPDKDIDLIGTLQQVLTLGLEPFGMAGLIVPIASLALLLLVVATISVVFTNNVRLPMVAGWDNLAPQWFTKLHSERKTPINSIIFTGAVALALGCGGLVGVNYQESFQFLLNTSFIIWALTYLVMFALPLIGLRGVSPRPGFWLRVAASSGFIMTLLYVVLSTLPIIEVDSWLKFAIKIAGVIVTANILGVLMFLAAERRRRGLSQKLDY